MKALLAVSEEKNIQFAPIYISLNKYNMIIHLFIMLIKDIYMLFVCLYVHTYIQLLIRSTFD